MSSAPPQPASSKPAQPIAKAKADTPAMQQYKRFKQQHPGCVLFFRMGDFYEMFYEDAVLAHKSMGVTLTQRSEGIPMAGVPYHAVEGYLRKMIEAGHRVAVCEQVGSAAKAKAAGTVVTREVTRVITPGTLTDETLLDEGMPNALAAVIFHGAGKGAKGRGAKGSSGEGTQNAIGIASIAWAELSTGAFSLMTVNEDDLVDELARIAPSELLYCETATGEVPERVKVLSQRLGCALTGRPAWQLRIDEATDVLCRQYAVSKLTGFGFEENDAALMAAGCIIHYLLETQRSGDDGRLLHLRPPRRVDRSKHLVIDQASLQALEVDRTLRSGQVAGSLSGIFRGKHGPVTAMGKRLVRQWLCYPLYDREGIEQRQSLVRAMVDDARFLEELRSALDSVHDVERITARLSVGRATPRDLVALGTSAARIETLREVLDKRPGQADYLKRIESLHEALTALGQVLIAACVESPPAHLREGGLIRDGYDKALDEQRMLQRDSHTWLAQYQAGLLEKHDLPHLKIGYNKVFGYYIEISAANRHKVRDDDEQFASWTRKQTLKNAERYITPALKTFEGKVLSAKSRAIEREQVLFDKLCGKARALIDQLHAFAQAVAELDVLSAFAMRAVMHRYVCPTIVDEPVLEIEAGRHPVLDELLGDQFVPNDVSLGSGDSGLGSRQTNDDKVNDHEPSSKSETPNPRPQSQHSLALITGPNMAGKSTYIRQTALLTLLAHTGSFVPADRAVVGLCDRIFTRVGANDELHAGQSTFMVEMTETANICHHATDRSLVILDEIGRGTSTLDGLSLAWAIAEFLAQGKPRTLFATHYHEITSLADRFDNVTNLSVTVREWHTPNGKDEIVFLHRVAPGKTDRSYGIHVAKLAGLPEAVIDRANTLLNELAVKQQSPSLSAEPEKSAPQMSLFTEYLDHPAIEALKGLNLDKMTPMEAFDALREIKEITG